MGKPLRYFLLGFLFWLVVDFTTTTAIKDPAGYYGIYMPAILIFYLGCPLVFTLLIYKFNMKDAGLFVATLLEIVIVEILFTNNPLFFAFPIMILAIALSIGIYSFLTFVPKWIVDGEAQRHKPAIIILTLAWISTLFLTVFGMG